MDLLCFSLPLACCTAMMHRERVYVQAVILLHAVRWGWPDVACCCCWAACLCRTWLFSSSSLPLHWLDGPSVQILRHLVLLQRCLNVHAVQLLCALLACMCCEHGWKRTFDKVAQLDLMDMSPAQSQSSALILAGPDCVVALPMYCCILHPTAADRAQLVVPRSRGWPSTMSDEQHHAKPRI